MPFDDPLAKAGEPATVPLAHVLGALSHALDLTEGQPAGHCMRATWIGVQLGQALGLDEAAIADLYYAVLLKDLGCSSNAARIAALFSADDLGFKRSAKLIGERPRHAVRFLMQQSAPHAGLLERGRTAVAVVAKADGIIQDLIQTRCERGASIASKLRFAQPVSQAIYHLDEHWDGGGRPDGLEGDAIPLLSRIALLSQAVDVFHTKGGAPAACDVLRARSGGWFDPLLVKTFLALARDRAFWSTLGSPDVEAAVLGLAPAQRHIRADDSYLDDIAGAFAMVVDAKSPYTSGHSSRVAGFTDRIASRLGVDAGTRQRLRRAALLHDVGKLGVSNRILDKPGKLDTEEWDCMRQHASHSERILARIPAFAELAEIGGSHHERLDGKGYPRGLDSTQIGFLTRIVSVADVCDALTAERPYRAAMPTDAMLSIMQKDAGTAFDPRCLEALQTIDIEEVVTSEVGCAPSKPCAAAEG